MAKDYIYSNQWKGWRAWVKYKGGNVKEYDKMLKRFQRAERYMNKMRYTNNYGMSENYNPERLAAYSTVYGTEEHPYMYEQIRKQIVQERAYNDVSRIERIEAKFRTARFRELYGNILVKGDNAHWQSLDEWFDEFMAGNISLIEYNNMIIQVRLSADYKAKMGADGGEY